MVKQTVTKEHAANDGNIFPFSLSVSVCLRKTEWLNLLCECGMWFSSLASSFLSPFCLVISHENGEKRKDETESFDVKYSGLKRKRGNTEKPLSNTLFH